MSTISTGHAKKLIQNYVENKIGFVIDDEETRAVWFSRDELLNSLNTPVHGVFPNGLRFYFGAYEEYDPQATRPPKYADEGNKITLVIIPTTARLDNHGHIKMHPYRKTEPLPYDLLDDPNATPGYDPRFTEANDGQICPPPPVLI
ncbi:MAG: hypothetical protein ABL876_18735 [Chitinophagaceae bacterium]